MTSDDSDKRMLRRALRALAVPWLMALAIVLFWLAGYYLDRWLGTWPAATIILLVAGVAAGGYQSYRMIMRVMKD
jgi:F0F1-type ATP synthase assembly protein I